MVNKKSVKNTDLNNTFMTAEHILTPEGYEKLKAELVLLKGPRRAAVVARITEALKLGDLKENAEYHDAKDEQGWLESRISELENILSQATIVSKKSSGLVAVGTEIVCQMNGKEKKYHIVGASEADPQQGKISHASPIAQSLLGRKVGDVVDITTPAGKMQCKILKIA